MAGSRLGLLFLITSAGARTLPFENILLSAEDIQDYPAVEYDHIATAPAWDAPEPACRAWPGTDSWPSDEDWAQLNKTLSGTLLRPVPPAAVCHVDDPHYNETACRWLVEESPETHAWLDDPLSTLTQWPQGGTCRLALNVPGVCTRGGYPEYVVNATTVKHIQAAVNFARNKNVRLVIKNTGHDFAGRSMGAGSLSIWVHNLKDFEFIPEYAVGTYKGMAVHIGAGLESWEHRRHMARHNISVVTPGYRTVGAVGGWISVAGHGWLTSKYGLGADQVLAINVVTADGQFRTIDPNSRDDEEGLWYALRGGGPSTFGVITSVILRAYPAVTLTRGSLGLLVNTSQPQADLEAFWTAISYYFLFCTNTVTPAGGYCHSYIRPLDNGLLNFSTTHTLPDLSKAQTRDLLRPLYAQLEEISLPIPLPSIDDIQQFPYADENPSTPASLLRETRYRSRIFPGYLFRNNTGAVVNTGWREVFASVRRAVEEGGYVFHGVGYEIPTPPPLREPGEMRWSDDGPARAAWSGPVVLLASLIEEDHVGTVLSAAEAKERDRRAKQYIGEWQQLMPAVGAYMNEADPMEEEWEWRFYGPEMRRLAGIKRIWDPWGVFWAPTTPGSCEWGVVTEDGYPGSQNGRLCRKRCDEGRRK